MSPFHRKVIWHTSFMLIAYIRLLGKQFPIMLTTPFEQVNTTFACSLSSPSDILMDHFPVLQLTASHARTHAAKPHSHMFIAQHLINAPWKSRHHYSIFVLFCTCVCVRIRQWLENEFTMQKKSERRLHSPWERLALRCRGEQIPWWQSDAFYFNPPRAYYPSDAREWTSTRLMFIWLFNNNNNAAACLSLAAKGIAETFL